MESPERINHDFAEATTAWGYGVDSESPLVLKRYRILAKIGHGGMGNVYKARHVHLNQLVAVKTIRLSQGSALEKSHIERFQREMTAIGALQHPHVVRATDGGEENNVYFLVMEHVEGTDLGNLSRTCGPLGLSDACELVRQASLGLAFIHAQGLIHRDIKPGNLLFSREGIVKVSDLGLARFASPREGESELTPEGSMLGTPDYIAPEQARDSRSADVRSDIYSLGCTLFRFLTGRAPYPSPKYATYAEKLLAHQHEPAPLVSDVLREMTVPCPENVSDIEQILKRMLAKNPQDRYSGFEEVTEALTPFARDHQIHLLWERFTNPLMTDLPETDSEHARANLREKPTSRTSLTSLIRDQRVLVGVGFALACVVWLFGLPWTFPGSAVDTSQEDPGNGSPGAVQTSGTPTHPLDALPAGKEHDLLAKAPTGFRWPEGESPTGWVYHPRLRQISRSGKSPGMVQLGKTPSENYELQVVLNQSDWNNGGGIFLGGKLPESSGESSRFLTLEVQRVVIRGKQKYAMFRNHGTIRRMENGKLSVGQRVGIDSEVLTNLQDELRLVVVVSADKLQSVVANGKSLTRLLVSESNHSVDPSLKGMLGIVGEENTSCSLARFVRRVPLP